MSDYQYKKKFDGVYDVMKGTGHCRGCDKPLKRGVDKAIKVFSFRNRGQHILICKECVEIMGAMIKE